MKKEAAKGKLTMPDRIAPMLCTPSKTVMDDPSFLHEVKFDGYRIIAHADKKTVRLDSRNSKNYTAKYPLVAEAVQSLNRKVIIDGEVVALDHEGKPDYEALQTYNRKRTPIIYLVFDLLWLDEKNLMREPLEKRRQLLGKLTQANEILKFSEAFNDGPRLYNEIKKLNLEGIVSKKRNSIYIPGARGSAWIKTPVKQREEFLIGGYVESEKAREFESLLLGAYNLKGKFVWKGRTGSGFKHTEMSDILKKLMTLEINSSPFINKVETRKGAIIHWIRPKLVIDVEFTTWTKNGRIRKPAIFLRFRNDKNPKDVIIDTPKIHT